MKKSCLLTRVLLCANFVAPGLALAQGMTAAKVAPQVPSQATAMPSVTNPAAAVPPVVYQSVFADTPTGVEMESADWKKANAEVGQFKRGHVDILKWEDAQGKPPMVPKPMAGDAAKPAVPSAMPSPSPSQATPAPAPAPAPSASPRPTPTPQAPNVHKH